MEEGNCNIFMSESISTGTSQVIHVYMDEIV